MLHLMSQTITALHIMSLSGADFTNATYVITIPPSEDSTEPSDFIIPQLFNITDDNIDEVVQSFILVAEIDTDVPEEFTSFQSSIQSSVPEGCTCSQREERETVNMEPNPRFGATRISINDNDGEVDLHFLFICIIFLC